MDLNVLATTLLDRLGKLGLTVATAESCTGGNIAHHITLIPGSSSAMLGGVVSYHNSVKERVLNVNPADIEQYGAVSRAVVEQMALGVKALTGADLTLATSGIAGPGGGTPDKPVGTVWMAVASPLGVISEVVRFDGSRSEVIEATTGHVMTMALRQLELIK